MASTLSGEMVPFLINMFWAVVIALTAVLNIIPFWAAFVILVFFLKYVTEPGFLAEQYCSIVLCIKKRE